jgi:signal peptidase II
VSETPPDSIAPAGPELRDAEQPPVASPVADLSAAAQHAPLAAALSVPGERLAAPFGATRVIADYGRPHPSYVFLALVSILSLAADIGSKSWAEHHLDGYPGTVEIWKNYVTLLLAKNRGGAWGLLQSTSENVRRPFFLLVSVAAIAFIMTLYRRLTEQQKALKWGLPLVLGGALGNVFDRIRYGHVIDFIDAHVLYKGIERHWPTFNIADVAICVGVGLMAVDMFTSKRTSGERGLSRLRYGWRSQDFARAGGVIRTPHAPPAQSGEPSVGWMASDAAVEPRSVVTEPAASPGEPPVKAPPTE